MPLPKTKHPLFDITIPSTGKKVKFRRFVAKEEKILLMGQQADDPTEVVEAIRQVINNCAMTKGFDVDKLTVFDFDYVFMKLRSQSVGNVIKLKYLDTGDEKEYEFEIDLDKIEIDMSVDAHKKIQVDENITMLLRYPTVAEMHKLLVDRSNDDTFNFVAEIVGICIDKIYDAEQVYDDYTQEELAVWLDDFSADANAQVKRFFDTIPALTYTIRYTNSQGIDREIALRGINDFFTFRSYTQT